MKKWLYKIFLGNLKFKERGFIDIPLWFIYAFSTAMLFTNALGTIFLIMAVPGLTRLLFTMLYAAYTMLIYLVPGKTGWKMITSPFSLWLERKYQWMYTEPK